MKIENGYFIFQNFYLASRGEMGAPPPYVPPQNQWYQAPPPAYAPPPQGTIVLELNNVITSVINIYW